MATEMHHDPDAGFAPTEAIRQDDTFGKLWR